MGDREQLLTIRTRQRGRIGERHRALGDVGLLEDAAVALQDIDRGEHVPEQVGVARRSRVDGLASEGQLHIYCCQSPENCSDRVRDIWRAESGAIGGPTHAVTLRRSDRAEVPSNRCYVHVCVRRHGVTSPVRIGLVGYGHGGRHFHAPLLTATEACELVGVVTTSPDRQAQVAADHPGVPTFGSIAELVEAGAEAATIATPAATHTALTDEALDRGMHVVCDKPFALDAKSASRTIDLAERKDRRLVPYQNRRWDSDFRTVRMLVDDGRLGSVIRFESRFERFSPDRGPRASGAGTLLDFGSHLVDQALVLLGPVTSVYAEWRLRVSDLDDDVFVALTHENGARSHLWASWSQPAPGNRFRVSGTEVAYVVPGPMDGQEAALVAGQSPRTLGDRWGLEPEERWGRLQRGDSVEVIPSARGAWDTFYPAFAAAVRAAGPVPVPAADALATAIVLDAASRSAISGEVVPAILTA